MATSPRSRSDLAREWIRRLIGYTTEITWFGSGGVAAGFARAVGDMAEIAQDLFVSLRRRLTLLASSGSDLDAVAQELGTERLSDARSHVVAVFVPYTATVEAITAGATDLVEVSDSAAFLAGDSLRIRDSAGNTEIFVILAITIGTGPHGDDELECAPLTGAYLPATDDVTVLLRTTIPVGTSITSQSGPSFETLDTVNVGDANPLFDGESAFLGLADKVDCECSTAGPTGNIPPDDLTEFATTIRVARVYNPEAGFGGSEETDPQLQYRASHRATLANQETTSWLFALARECNPDVLRCIKDTSTALSTVRFRVLKRSGGSFSAAELLELKSFMEDRFRSQLLADPQNLSLTAVSVEARVKLSTGADLKTCWRAAASSFASYLDYRVWTFGESVDNSEILQLLLNTSGIASVETSTFVPAAPVAVSALSLPTLVYFALEDQDTGETFGGDLAVSF